jgi:RNA recognition motif-containing protein
MSVRVYVGNLPKEFEREELEALFSEHKEDIVSIKLITDRKTGKCRGFGFVTLKTDEQADALVEKFSNYVIQDNTLKIEKALPRAKGEDSGEGSPSPNRRKAKPSRGGSNGNKVVVSEAEAAQPDPRWAQELEKLKELLAAQTAGS